MLAALLLLLPQDVDEKAARRAVDDLVRSVNEAKGPAFAAQFDVPRLLKAMVAQAEIDPARLDGLGKALRLSLAVMAKQLGPWGELRRCTLRPLAGGAEVEANCILRDEDGLRERLRFWLVRGPEGTWKTYDFESVHDGIRLSVLAAGMVGEALGDPRKAAALARGGRSLMKVMELAAEGEHAKALALLREARDAGLPDGVAATLDLLEGALVDAEGDAEAALAHFDRALRRQPDLPRAHRLRSECLLGLGRHEEAVAAETAFMKILGDDAEAWGNIGRAHRERGRDAEAVEAHLKGAACDEDDADNRLWAGVLLAAGGKTGEALSQLRASLAKAVDGDAQYDAAAEALMERGGAEALLELARDRARVQPKEVAPRLHQGHALRRLGRPAEAETMLREALAADGEDGDERPRILEELACALAHLGKPAEARNFAEAIDEGEEGAATHYTRAYIQAVEGKAAEALAALREAFRLEAGLHAKVTLEAAFKTLRAGEEGRALLAKAKAKAAYTDASFVPLMADRYERVLPLAQARTAEAPDDAIAWYHLGLSLRHLGRLEEAEPALRRGLAVSVGEDDRRRCWSELGQVAARRSQAADARGWAAKLLEVEGWKEDAHYILALVHAGARDLEEALDEAEKLLKESPHRLGELEKDAAFEALRKTPGWKALKARLEQE